MNFSIMDLKDIKNVNELIEANEAEESRENLVGRLCKDIFTEEPDVGKDVVITLLTGLLKWHHEAVDNYIAKGDAKNAAIWALDLNKIDEAITLIKCVEM